MSKFEPMSIDDLSVDLRKRFCKDNNIPIKIFEQPYFFDRIKLLQPYYDTLQKLDVFICSLRNYNCEQDYFEDYSRIKNEAISDIKNSDGYQRFNSENMNLYAIEDKYRGLPNKDIFHPSNDNRKFISIDMKKANFSSLRYFDPGIFNNAETWEEFVGKYTDNKHIINSKYIRQVILGNCNPKRHIVYEKYVMSKFIRLVLNCYEMNRIVFFSNDEIIIDVTNDTELHITGTVSFLKSFVEELIIPFKIEYFTLRKIPDMKGYYKEFTDGKIEFKCVSAEMMPFAIRKIRNEELTEYDKVFIYEGNICKFMEVPNFEQESLLELQTKE